MERAKRAPNYLQELNTELPERFREIPFPDAQRSRIVGLAVETDGNRRFLLDKMASAIQKGLHAVVACIDVDYLKYINEAYGRDYGDEAIRHSVYSTAETVDKFFPESKCYAWRDSAAADEAWFLVLAKQEQLEKVAQFQEEANTRPKILLSKQNERGISFSVGVSHTASEINRSFLVETRKNLESGTLEMPFDLLERLRKQASSVAAEIKTKKTLVALEKVKIKAVKAEEFKSQMARELSYMRTSEEAIRSVFDGFEELIREELKNG